MGTQKDIVRKIIIKKIEALEKEIRETPYHKGTEHHIGLLKAKVARMRSQLGEREEKFVGSGGGVGYAVGKQGDASCALVGPPSAGKSTLLNVLAGSHSKTGDYDFTTLTVVPGMMTYKGAKIQIFDLPGLIEGASEGRGGGKKVLSAIRNSDLIILMTDVDRPEWIEKARAELYQAGIRLNQESPKIEVKKTNRGGIRIVDPFGSFRRETVLAVVEEFGFKNAEIVFRERLDRIDQLVDFFSGNRVYLPAIEAVNKIDERPELKFGSRILISAQKEIGIEQLKEAIWQKLGLMRIYLKRKKTAKPDFEQPLILKRGATVADAVGNIYSGLTTQVSGVLIWGPGAKFPGQLVPLSFPLQDEMVLYFVKKI